MHCCSCVVKLWIHTHILVASVKDFAICSLLSCIKLRSIASLLLVWDFFLLSFNQWWIFCACKLLSINTHRVYVPPLIVLVCFENVHIISFFLHRVPRKIQRTSAIHRVQRLFVIEMPICAISSLAKTIVAAFCCSLKVINWISRLHKMRLRRFMIISLHRTTFCWYYGNFPSCRQRELTKYFFKWTTKPISDLHRRLVTLLHHNRNIYSSKKLQRTLKNQRKIVRFVALIAECFLA